MWLRRWEGQGARVPREVGVMKLGLWEHHPHPGPLRTRNKNRTRQKERGISPQHPSEVGTVTTPILQTGKQAGRTEMA